MATEASIRTGRAYVKTMDEDAARALRQRITNGELISVEALQEGTAIFGAIKNGRLFTIPGPGGADYYPAFYADQKYDRRLIEQVAKQLGALPAAAKYHFFTSSAFSLGGKTPLDALDEGRLEDVLRAATECSER